MQLTLTHNSDTNVTLHITADGETLAQIKRATLQRFNTDNLKIPGFRGGKAPLEMVEKHVDQQLLQTEFLDNVLNHYYSQAVIKENLRTTSQPQVDLKKFVPFSTVEVDITVDVIGKITLPDYQKIKKTKPAAKVTAKDITDVLNSLAERTAERKTVSRAAKNGDEVVIDFAGADAKGEPVSGADGKDYPLKLGSNSFIPGFEDNVVGMKPGETKDFTIPFPKDYGVAALQGKKVTFTVTAKTINELAAPKIDDAFARKTGPFTSLENLKEDIKRQLTVERQRELDQQFESELLKEISDKTKVAIPDSVVDDQVLRAEEEEKQNLIYRGQTWQEHLKAEGVTEEEHRKRNRDSAAEQVKVGIIIGAIGDAENIVVGPEELEIRMQLLKGQYKDSQMQAELEKPEARQDIASRIRIEKVLAKLSDYATKK